MNVKRLIDCWISITVMLTFSGCGTDNTLELDTNGRPIDVSFSALMIEDAKTKTSYDGNTHLGLWKREDMAGVIAGYGGGSFTDARMQEFSIQERNNGGKEFLSSATFKGKLTDKGNQTYTYYAVYPYTAFQTVTNATSVSSRLEERQYPDLKSWDGACDMLAAKPITVTSSSIAADNLQLQFTRLFGMLRLRFGTSITDTYGSETVETISIESADAADKLAGKFTINLAATDAPDPVMSSTASDCFNRITLDYRGRNATLSNIDAYFVVNPGTYDNVTITVKTKDHTLTLPRTNLTVTRGSVAAATMSWKGGDTAVESVPLLPKNPATLKILTFGHSYVLDSMEYMDELLNDAGITNVTFANFYIGNCSLQTYWGHVTNAGNTKGGSDKISYYKRYYNGSKVITLQTSKTVIDALCDEKWDVVVFQTSLEYEGIYAQIGQYLRNIADYVKMTCQAEKGREPVLAWHMFWAFGSPCNNSRWDPYDRNQEQYYKANIQAAKDIIRLHNIQLIIPTGTAIQSLRHSFLNNPYNGSAAYEFTRDDHHLDYMAGQYTAACTWFEYFMKPCFGISVLGDTFTPSPNPGVPVTAENRETLQRAAILACQNPFEISHLDVINPMDVTASTEIFESAEKGNTETFTIIDNLTW